MTSEKLIIQYKGYEIEINDISKKEIILAIIVAITNDVNRNQQASNYSD